MSSVCDYGVIVFVVALAFARLSSKKSVDSGAFIVPHFKTLDGKET